MRIVSRLMLLGTVLIFASSGPARPAPPVPSAVGVEPAFGGYAFETFPRANGGAPAASDLPAGAAFCRKVSDVEVNWQKAYCRSDALDPSQRAEIDAALDRISERGPACEEIARRGRRILRNRTIGVFPYGADSTPLVTGYAFAVRGGGTSPVILLEAPWFTIRATPDYPYDLAFALVHEIEHTMGREHIGTDANGVDLTAHVEVCSGIGVEGS